MMPCVLISNRKRKKELGSGIEKEGVGKRKKELGSGTGERVSACEFETDLVGTVILSRV